MPNSNGYLEFRGASFLSIYEHFKSFGEGAELPPGLPEDIPSFCQPLPFGLGLVPLIISYLFHTLIKNLFLLYLRLFHFAYFPDSTIYIESELVLSLGHSRVRAGRLPGLTPHKMEGREERLGDLALDSVREQIGELLMGLLNLDLNMPIYRARLSIPRWVDYTAGCGTHTPGFIGYRSSSKSPL